MLISNGACPDCICGQGCASTIGACNPLVNLIPAGAQFTNGSYYAANPGAPSAYAVRSSYQITGLAKGTTYAFINYISAGKSNGVVNVFKPDNTATTISVSSIADGTTGGIPGCGYPPPNDNCGMFTATDTTAWLVIPATFIGFSPFPVGDSIVFPVCLPCVRGYYVHAVTAGFSTINQCCSTAQVDAFDLQVQTAIKAIPADLMKLSCGSSIEIDYTLGAFETGCNVTISGEIKDGAPAANLCSPFYTYARTPCCSSGELEWDGMMIRVCGPSRRFCLQWKNTCGGATQFISYGPIADGQYIDIYPPSEAAVGCKIFVNECSFNNVTSYGASCVCTDYCDLDP